MTLRDSVSLAKFCIDGGAQPRCEINESSGAECAEATVEKAMKNTPANKGHGGSE